MDRPSVLRDDSAHTSTTPAAQGLKRLRPMETDDFEGSLPNPGVANMENVVHRSRGSTACDKCRSRKTKCDNRRPSCGYCLKRQIPCVYADDAPTSWSVSGEEILCAISKLSTLVESQQQHHHHCSCCTQGQDSEISRSRTWENSNETSFSNLNVENAHCEIKPQGVESILGWDAFADLQLPSCLYNAKVGTPNVSNQPLPSMSYNELAQLELKYIDSIHTKNPILDLPELHRIISQVAENGLDWSVQTCLMTLVCAIGAITQQYQDQHILPHGGSTPGAPPVTAEDLDLSVQFWSLAVKRLGLAMGQNDIQSVQCLCLAGIWYMIQMQPLEAWNYFNLAGAAWHCLNLTNGFSREPVDDLGDQSTSFTTNQALYFTLWKSIAELRYEVHLPGSILDGTHFPHAFPLPPYISSENNHPEITDSERSWYYYLAEIAARHLFNRISQVHSWTTIRPTRDEIKRLVDQAEILEAQIHNWYMSLPPPFHFDIPTGNSTQSHHDDMTHLLRNRYISLKELVGRPFVKLCVESSQPIDPALRSQVIELASQSVQYCIHKISQVAPHRHQGTWLMLRTVASSAMVLCAVDLAHQRSGSMGAQDLVLPGGWRETITRAVNLIGPYWDVPNGGASEMRNMIHLVLNSYTSS